MTLDELNWIAEAQFAKWHDQETRKRQQKQTEGEREAARQRAEDLKSQAEEDTRTAQGTLDTFRKILAGSLGVNLAFDWEKFVDKRAVPPFNFSVPKPNKEQIRLHILGPKPAERMIPHPDLETPSVFEVFLPFLRRRRLEREAEAAEEFEKESKRAKAEYLNRLKAYHSRKKEVAEAYGSAVGTYNAKLNQEKEKYLRIRHDFLARQKAHNSAVLAFRSRYEAGSSEAVEQYMQMVLDRSSYPDPIAGEPDARFDEVSKTLIVNFWVPGPEDVPNVVEYKYVASRKAVKPVEMKPKDFEAFYDDIVGQIALRTIREAFVADYPLQIGAVVINNWVRGIDRKTGKHFTVMHS
jgi:restriction system protein